MAVREQPFLTTEKPLRLQTVHCYGQNQVVFFRGIVLIEARVELP